MSFTVVISFLDTAERKPDAKRFDVIVRKVEKPDRESAWRLCLDTQRKAANTPTIALVNIEVMESKTHKPVWSLR